MMYNSPDNADEVLLAATVRKQEECKKHKIPINQRHEESWWKQNDGVRGEHQQFLSFLFQVVLFDSSLTSKMRSFR